MGWNIVELRDCLNSIDNGKSLVCENEPRRAGGPAILKLSAVTYGYYQRNENKAMINPNKFIKAGEVHAGDLLFTRKNTPELVGMCAYVFETPSNLMMPDLIFRLNTNDRCDKLYLWNLINHVLFRGNIKCLASGSSQSMSNISKERLYDLRIPLPMIELQNKFANYVKLVEISKVEILKGLEKSQRNFG